MDVAIQKRAYVFVGRRDFMLVQDTDDNARIGHACDLDVVQIVRDTEALFKGRFERLNTRASRMDNVPSMSKSRRRLVIADCISVAALCVPRDSVATAGTRPS